MNILEGFDLHGVYEITHHRNNKIINKYYIDNLIVNEGKTAFLEATFNSLVTDWEVGFITGIFTAVATSTFASHVWTETTLLDSASKPIVFDPATTTGTAASTATSVAINGPFGVPFEVLTSGNINGVFLRDSTNNILFSETATTFAVVAGDYVSILYTITLSQPTFRGYVEEGCIRMLDSVFIQDTIVSTKMGLASGTRAFSDTFSSHAGWTDKGLTHQTLVFETAATQKIALDITTQLGARFDWPNSTSTTYNIAFVYSDVDSILLLVLNLGTQTVPSATGATTGLVTFIDFTIQL